MIVCPNCNHQNPDSAQACEACFTPLPTTTSCPYCGAQVQTDASFCGQCGSNLRPSGTPAVEEKPEPVPIPDMPNLVTPDPLVNPDPLPSGSNLPEPAIMSTGLPDSGDIPSVPATVVNQPLASELVVTPPPFPVSEEPIAAPPPLPVKEKEESNVTPLPQTVASSPSVAKTQLQQQAAKLLHTQTNTTIELPQNLSVVHMGKPNDQIPPDVDVSGFPNSEIVSRVHADIRLEGDAYYIEDVGSSNGTYINHNPLLPGNRHRLRSGDRIALGKGDMMTFLFQLS